MKPQTAQFPSYGSIPHLSVPDLKMLEVRRDPLRVQYLRCVTRFSGELPFASQLIYNLPQTRVPYHEQRRAQGILAAATPRVFDGQIRFRPQKLRAIEADFGREEIVTPHVRE